MAFVDGENLTMRAQKVACGNGLNLTEGRYFHRNTFVWIPNVPAGYRIYAGQVTIQATALRSSFYTSVCGDDKALNEVRNALWQLGFNPQVFKKNRQDEKAKGVDIALTKDMLGHAFLENYDTAVLIAGDGDYVPLIEEVKRLGKRVHVLFLADEGLNPALKLAADEFYGLTAAFLAGWGN